MDMIGEVSYSCPSVARVFPLEGHQGILRVTLGFTSSQQSGTKKKHFGQPFDQSCKVAQAAGQKHFTSKILSVLKSQGGNSEGLFRIPGNSNAIHRLMNQLDAGLDLTFEFEDEYTLIGLLKAYFMELPESLIPEKTFNLLKEVGLEDVESAKKKIKEILLTLPKDEMQLLSELLPYFETVANNNTTTKMSARTISTAIGPSILLSPKLRKDPIVFISLLQASEPLLEFVIKHQQYLMN
eukprot:TRINITY_DN4094_c0_g1_i3.p1 TRINITY_DN4094_c0_g1~~TRINITY_DN4094_c0_g1_i3.p1  ORF type:complete len:239 (-),score=57.30 TRINITY_DN4094_c0_g1_i3:159-875(-)